MKDIIKKRISRTKYNHSEKGKISDINYQKTEKYRLALKKYWSSKKGKLNKAKMDSKRNKMGFNLILKNIIDEPIEYHHMNDKDVAELPKDLHQLYPGRNKNEHRFMCNSVIKQIYGGD